MSPRSLWRWDGPPVIEVLDVAQPGAERPHMSVVAQEGRPGVVVIAEWKSRVALVRHDRPAVAEVLWELPRGFGEPVDDLEGPRAQPAAAAARELAEETGLLLEEARHLGSVFPDSGLLGNAVGVVHGQVAEAPDELRLDEVEDLRWVPVGDLPQLISTGVLRDGITLSALAIWMSLGDADPAPVPSDGDH